MRFNSNVALTIRSPYCQLQPMYPLSLSINTAQTSLTHGLVYKSLRFSFVGLRRTLMYLCLSNSLTQWYGVYIYLLPVDMKSSAHRLLAASLSPNIWVGDLTNHSQPISVSNCLIHMASAAACLIAMYSLWNELRPTCASFLLTLAMGPPIHMAQ